MAKENKGTPTGRKISAAIKQLQDGRTGKQNQPGKDRTTRLTRSQDAVREANAAMKNAKKKGKNR